MKTPFSLALLSLLTLPLTLSAQGPQINHFGGTSYTSSNGTDSAFCKGQDVVRLVGIAFASVPPDETYDSTTVALGGWPCPLLLLTDTLAVVALPDSFIHDTTLQLVLTRHGSNDIGLPVLATATHPARVEGDHVRIAYPPGPWCVGTTNPVPVLIKGRGTWPGTFIPVANGSFNVVAATGEVPLHSGAVGTQEWTYEGGHPRCPADTAFTRVILGRTVAIALYGGSALAEWCQSDPPVDASAALPPGGRFIGDPGLHIADDSLGTVVPALSLPRTYTLRYVPPYACSDTATVAVTILRAPTADIDLPGGYACAGLPAHMQALTLDAGAWAWTLDGLPVGVAQDYTLPSPADGDTVALTATSFQGCTASDTLVVHVRPRPDVQAITAPKAVPEGILPAYTAVTNLAPAALHWRLDTLSPATAGRPGGWLPFATGAEPVPTAGEMVDVQPSAMYPDHRTRAGCRMRLLVSATADGCTGLEDTIYTEVLPGGSPVYVPQAMTPDGDGMNDTWIVKLPDGALPSDYRLELYNRAGGKVFELWPIHDQWDGGGLPDGVYWWVLRDAAGRRLDADGLTIRRK
jgi:gliding motility-associated-like protein